MNEPYQLVADIWEGNPDLDAAVLKANGVAGLIVRLNSMSGGHHLDDRFAQNWALAKTFPVQTVYFVYNPWVTGQANFDWLMAHLPADYGQRRLMVDVEVRYSGYSPVTYAAELGKFIALVEPHFPLAIYTGGGFLDLLQPWPTGCDYWWAGYSNILTACTNWAAYKHALENLDMSAFTKFSPGRVLMWQATGDGVRLEGFGGHAVDVNVFPGTLNNLCTWFHVHGEEVEPAMANAIGLFTKTAGWTNPAFDFIVGYAGKNLLINPNLKPIETQAAAEGKPFLVWYDFNVTWYSDSQYMAVDERWPSVVDDQPLQKFITVLANRNLSAVVVSVLDNLNESGKIEDPGYVAYAASRFIGRVGDWLKVNKPAVQLIVASSNAFISAKAPNVNNWIGRYLNCAVQLATKPLVDALPDPTEKPQYLDNRATCEFWRYYEISGGLALITYRMGDRARLWDWLGFGAVTPPPDEPPVVDPELAARVAAAEGRLAAIETYLASWPAFKK